MKRIPLYLLLFAPVPVLAKQVVYIYQVTWYAGLRLALVFACLGLLLMLILYKPLQRFHTMHAQLTRNLNIITASMLIFMLLAIGTSAIIRDTKPHRSPQGIAAGPDVYFIVLDSYTSSTAFLERFSYDNSWFYQELTSLGFLVGDCSSRYAYTGPSLGSILNGGGDVPEITALNWQLIQRSQLRTALEAKGYDTVAFATGYDWDEIHDAAYYFQPDLPGITDFELFFLGLTSWKDIRGDHFRARTANLLENLPAAASLSGSQFTYAHIMQPHPPFIFHADGSPLADASLVNPEWKYKGTATVMYFQEVYDSYYLEQVEYISHAILGPLKIILDKDPDPLIILIGDHGPWYSPEYNLSTLCAVYGDLPLDPTQAVNKITHPAD